MTAAESLLSKRSNEQQLTKPVFPESQWSLEDPLECPSPGVTVSTHRIQAPVMAGCLSAVLLFEHAGLRAAKSATSPFAPDPQSSSHTWQTASQMVLECRGRFAPIARKPKQVARLTRLSSYGGSLFGRRLWRDMCLKRAVFERNLRVSEKVEPPVVFFLLDFSVGAPVPVRALAFAAPVYKLGILTCFAFCGSQISPQRSESGKRIITIIQDFSLRGLR